MVKRTVMASILALSTTVTMLVGPALADTYANQSASANTVTFAEAATSVKASLAETGQLPPGVTMDKLIKPLAPLNASDQEKFNAIMTIAKSKLGTPYVWGHNEDKGTKGFDCSNFTSYVYHHALGYKMSTASRTQNRSVGWTVPKSQMRPGDLVIFNNGSHVSIYAGNNQVIQEGGGLGKVGYLSIAPKTYWGKHITAVKRMY
ncbi:C40 family peptidase [Heliophilum fasciatum]|uniref:Cell wall-associated NlpC family hydrolase n=1 Tax=Heliophilum fasciatum TaxID=35700 RepID=A0A4R2RM29_9FIRM|nr:C40 family peptidase [Heliophilum fasciatum]MCW2277663.1 cell wall-associated NlpC family hydrolase [Heliophilum fasciatum]TCP65010.1 cell wall-associated NlpC family hydrolase [Heliophilum fasciatum]